MSERRGYIHATREIEGDNDAVISSTELRIHYRYWPGAPEFRGNAIWLPADPDEIEVNYVERETAPHKWERVEVDDGDWLWAENWLERHFDYVLQEIAEADAAARDDAAEMRRDR